MRHAETRIVRPDDERYDYEKIVHDLALPPGSLAERVHSVERSLLDMQATVATTTELMNRLPVLARCHATLGRRIERLEAYCSVRETAAGPSTASDPSVIAEDDVERIVDMLEDMRQSVRSSVDAFTVQAAPTAGEAMPYIVVRPDDE